MNADETIVAQASAQGNARRGIVRLSGDAVLDAVAPLFFFRRPTDDFPPETPEELAPLAPVSPSAVVPNVERPAVVSGWLAPWGTETKPVAPPTFAAPVDSDSADVNEARESVKRQSVAAPFEPPRLVRCALFYWPSGRGFTGQRAVELHLPGAPPVLDAAVRSICSTGNARLARRGEFALRAFLNGRIDLTQAEAILGAIDARSDGELQTALEQLAGNLSRAFGALRETLFDVLCNLEAGFDFVEEDIEFVSTDEIRAQLQNAISQIDETLDRTRSRGSLDRAPRVVLAGLPNAGKSSLYNRLVQTFGAQNAATENAAALVSDVAGTTRDYLETELTVDDVSFVLVDSAGVENVQDAEKTGAFENKQKSADFQTNQTPPQNGAPNALPNGQAPPKVGETEKAAATSELSPRQLAQLGLKRVFADASLILRCRDAASTDFPPDFGAELGIPADVPTLDVATKRDGAASTTKRQDESLKEKTTPAADAANDAAQGVNAPLETSAATGFGVETLGRRIADRLRAEMENGEIVPSTAVRCQESLREANDALRRALALLDGALFDEVLVAAEIRVALDRIGLVVGAVHTEDLLDRIFSRFCVGK
ncbi:MAG: 50S ribosome-binding GTPase [Thermoguttaceae bacterium]|nr:50S ribosome-binding GTPase [Thermoguttaceae bacterium]